MTSPYRVGMIGCGFMGRVHSHAWRVVASFFPELERRPVLQAACARDAARVAAFAEVWGYAHAETDWRRLLARDDIDAVDICVPNHLHREIAVAAAEAGKAVLCEKPLAMTVAEGEAMAEAVDRAGVPTMVWYNYRRVPSVSLARRLVDEGRIGRPYHYRAQFLQDWTIAEDVPQGGAALWRLDAAAAGSGVTGDLLAHSIDAAMWLNGPITRVLAETETFVKERLHQETGNIEPVGIDDACIFIGRFANGSMGVFESTRYARGHKAFMTFELNGADGSVRFDLHEPEYLDFFEYRSVESGGKVSSHTAGWRRIHVTNGEHPYMDRWWVPGLVIGYEHSFVHAVGDFLKGLETGMPAQPDFRNALETQKVCEAVLRSAGSGRWEETGAAARGMMGSARAAGSPAMATKAAELYEEDFYAWTRDQAASLRCMAKDRWNGPLDLEHLAEEIEDVGSERRYAVRSQLRRIIEHLLKLEHSRARDPRSGWQDLILDARAEIADRMTSTIRREVENELPRLYSRARAKAANGLSGHGEHDMGKILPESCPYTFDELLTDAWYPANRHAIADDGP